MTDNQKIEAHLLNALDCIHRKDKIKNWLLNAEVYIERSLFIVNPGLFNVIEKDGVKEFQLKHAPKTHPKI